MSDENIVPEEPITPPMEETTSEEVVDVQKFVNEHIAIKFAIPTEGVVLSEKGKGIKPIMLPQQSMARLLEDPFWFAITQIWNQYQDQLLDTSPTPDIRKIKAILKTQFENKFGKVFTEAEYRLAPFIIEAAGLMYSSDFLGDIKEEQQNREGSSWEQGYRTTQGVLVPAGGAARPGDMNITNSPIDGPKAAMIMADRLGYGTLATFRLPNSGIALKFSNPSNNELYNLDEQIDAEKVHLGLNTLGYFFGANGQKFISTVTNFILSKVISTNPNITDRTALKKLIKVTDIHALAIGIANVMYPDGYPFSTPCVHCNKVNDHGLLKPIRTWWVDNPSIPDSCKRIMEKKTITTEDITEYQAEIERNIKNNFFVLGDDCTPALIRFCMPSLHAYEQQSEAWVNRVESLVSADRTDLSTDERKERYNSHAEMLLASQYLAYVEYIYIMTDEEHRSEDYAEGRYEQIVQNGSVNQKLTNRDDILSQLNLISQDNITTDSFLQAVSLYRESSHLYIVAVPEVLCECQACKLTPEELDHQRKHPKLTPLDAINLFFTLRGRRFNTSLVPIKQVKS